MSFAGRRHCSVERFAAMKPNPVSMHSWTHEFAHPGLLLGMPTRGSHEHLADSPNFMSLGGRLPVCCKAHWQSSWWRRYPFVLLNEYDGLNRWKSGKMCQNWWNLT
eukprot:symbB.v1.2.029428.t1/scaffold3153.1/size62324/7